ncbi:hypothetical protein AB0J43_04990 [Nonomuraea fuscirosea]
MKEKGRSGARIIDPAAHRRSGGVLGATITGPGPGTGLPRADADRDQLGLVITVAATALTIASPLWGHALRKIGLRLVLLPGLGLATAGLTGFAAVAALFANRLASGREPLFPFFWALWLMVGVQQQPQA